LRIVLCSIGNCDSALSDWRANSRLLVFFSHSSQVFYYREAVHSVPTTVSVSSQHVITSQSRHSAPHSTVELSSTRRMSSGRCAGDAREICGRCRPTARLTNPQSPMSAASAARGANARQMIWVEVVKAESDTLLWTVGAVGSGDAGRASRIGSR
jgi:hypothetical protein